MVGKVYTCMYVVPATSEPHYYLVLRDYKQQKLCVCKFLLQNTLFGPKKYENCERKIMPFMSRDILLFDHLWKLTELLILLVELQVKSEKNNPYNKQFCPTQGASDLDISQFAEGQTFPDYRSQF